MVDIFHSWGATEKTPSPLASKPDGGQFSSFWEDDNCMGITDWL